MHVFLFDIDGTLLNSGGAGKAAIETALEEEFGVTLRKQVPFSGRTDRAIGNELLTSHDLAPTLKNWERLVHGYLSRLPHSLSRHDGKVLPGIGSLLIELARRGASLGLLTGNLRRGAQVKLEHFDLWRHFNFGGFGDHHLERDDVAREAFQTIHGQFNGTVLPENIWVIGDTPLDVQCARAIGARAVAVATGWHSLEQLKDCDPDFLLADLSDPAALLGEL